MPETGTRASQGPQKGWRQGRVHSACARKRLTSEYTASQSGVDPSAETVE
jgi:hypothetical protein